MYLEMLRCTVFNPFKGENKRMYGYDYLNKINIWLSNHFGNINTKNLILKVGPNMDFA